MPEEGCNKKKGKVKSIVEKKGAYFSCQQSELHAAN